MKVIEDVEEHAMEDLEKDVQDKDRPFNFYLTHFWELQDKVEKMDKAFNKLTSITLGIMQRTIFGTMNGAAKVRKGHKNAISSQVEEVQLDKRTGMMEQCGEDMEHLVEEWNLICNPRK